MKVDGDGNEESVSVGQSLRVDWDPEQEWEACLFLNPGLRSGVHVKKGPEGLCHLAYPCIGVATCRASGCHEIDLRWN